jgi:plastocyanin
MGAGIDEDAIRRCDDRLGGGVGGPARIGARQPGGAGGGLAVDGQRFDRLTKSLSGAASRRILARLVAGGVIGVGAALIGRKEAAACRTLGEPCRRTEQCCAGECRGEVCRCPQGQERCRAGCCVVVEIVDFSFQPARLVVPVGTSVKWINRDRTVHTVTAWDGEFDSGDLGRNDTFEVTFETPGNRPYRCLPHPSAMRGRVVVT